MSSLVDHARRELELLGEEEEVILGYLRVIEAFSEQGHSGLSAMIAVNVIKDLLLYKNLTPLTDNPDEWTAISEEVMGGGERVWQSKRNPEAFSKDGGKTYYLLSEGDNPGNPYPLHRSKKEG